MQNDNMGNSEPGGPRVRPFGSSAETSSYGRASLWARIPGSDDKFVIGSVAGFGLALIAALWLVYMGVCTGTSCFVIEVYPPAATPETFTQGVENLRDALPWLVPVALVVFLTFWFILGWTLWIESPSAWQGKSGITAIVSIVMLLAFASVLSYVALDKIGSIDGSIAVWISFPSFLCAIVAFIYLWLWFLRERDAGKIAQQVGDASKRISQLSVSVADIASSNFASSEGSAVMTKIVELKDLDTNESDIAETARTMKTNAAAHRDLHDLDASLPPNQLMFHSMAASKNLSQVVNGPFWEFAKAPRFRAEVEWGLKTLAGELILALDLLNTTLEASLKSIWDDLEKLDQEAGKRVIQGGTWVTVDNAAVIAKFEGSGWQTWARKLPRTR